MDYGYGGGGGSTTYTSYGAQGGTGGGGFLNTGSQQDRQTSGASRRDYSKDTLRPVTIKQLLEAQTPTPETFLVDGSEITQVTIVGQVRNISTHTTHLNYRLDDGTGTIEVLIYIDPENPGGGVKISENAYARAYGRMKEFSNRRHLASHVIRPVPDYNEVQFHMLEATAIHLHHTQGPPPSKDGSGVNAAGTGQQKGANGLADAGPGKGRTLPAGLSASAKRVYNCLVQSPVTNEGLHMQELAVKLNMDMGDVGKAGDELLMQGLIYPTVDDQTWAILDL